MLFTLLIQSTRNNNLDFQASKNEKNQVISNSTSYSCISENIENLSTIVKYANSKISDLIKFQNSNLSTSSIGFLTFKVKEVHILMKCLYQGSNI